MEGLRECKLAVSALMAGLTALWGWFGWLILLWLGCLIFDYITGSLAAAKEGCWSSKRAREGIWQKVGCMAAVMVAAAADLLLGTVAAHIPNLELSYGTLLCPLVVVWYTLTELGSAVENAVRLGAPVPEFLRRTLELMKKDRK